MGLCWRICLGSKFFSHFCLGLVCLGGSLFLIGCSTIPLQEDVTHIPMREIVQKVVCEVREELEAQLEQKGFSDDLSKIREIDQNIRVENGNLRKIELDTKEAYEKLLEKRDDYYDKVIELYRAVEDAKTTKVALENAKKAYREEINSRPISDPERAKYTRLFYKTRTDFEKSLLQELYLKKALSERTKLFIAIKEIKEKRDRLVVKINQLESKRGNYSKLARFLGNAILLDFDFDITENNNATGAASFVMPVQFGTFTIGVDAGDKKARQNKETIYVYSLFDDILKYDFCDPLWDYNTVYHDLHPRFFQAKSPRETLYPISGNLQTGKIVSQYLKLRDNNLKFQERDLVHSRKIQFTTVFNGAVKPSFSIAPVGSGFNQISGNIDFVADRTDVHSVTVRLRPAAKIKGSKVVK